MIKLVIFDMDGILIDSEPYWQTAEIEVFGKLGLQLTPEICRKYQAIKIEELIAIYHKQYHWENFDVQKTKNDLVNTVQNIVKQKGKAMKGVLDVLDFLKNKKIPKAIASGSDFSLIDTVVKKLMIKDKFEFIHSGEAEKRGKPFPDIFLTVANYFDLTPEQCLVIEDSVNGVKAALAAGMKVIAIPEKEQSDNYVFKNADYVLKDLSEFTENIFQSL